MNEIKNKKINLNFMKDIITEMIIIEIGQAQDEKKREKEKEILLKEMIDMMILEVTIGKEDLMKKGKIKKTLRKIRMIMDLSNAMLVDI